jgi:hypothetical protein
MTELKHIDPMTLGKIHAAFAAIMGFFVGIVIALGGLSAFVVRGSSFGAALGLAAVVVLPILYAIMGFVAGVIVALIYNFLAKRIGGIKVVLR